MGTALSVEETTVMMEIDKDVKVRLLKTAVVDVNPEKNLVPAILQRPA